MSDEKKKWPTVQKHHYLMYASRLGKYGITKTGIVLTNEKMLEELGLEDTHF